MVALKLILIVLFFGMSALISGSEVAYFSRKSPSNLGEVKAFGLLATILLLNNIANSYLSSLMADVVPASDVVVGLLLSMAVAVFAEFLPKRLALTYPHIFVRATEFLYRPLATLFSFLKIRVSADTTRLTTYAVMEAVVDAIQNSDMREDERLYIARMLYAIHGKGYAILYPISESPLLKFEMSVKEAIDLIENMGYDREWVPVYYVDPNEITHMLHVETLKNAPRDEPVMDLPMDRAVYFPIIGNFVRILGRVENTGHIVLVDEFGNVKGFSYKEDVEIWILSAGDTVTIRTPLLEIYIITGREVGPINWDLADLFQHELGRAAKEGDSIVVDGLRFTVIDDIFVRIEKV